MLTAGSANAESRQVPTALLPGLLVVIRFKAGGTDHVKLDS